MSEKNILEEIAEKTRERIRKEKLQFPLKQLKILAEKAPQQPSFLEALKKPGMSYICEVKKASPSKGLIAPEFPYVDIARECFKRNLKMFSARRFISGCSDRKPNILNTV